ncbi:MAG: hypothetical protein KGL35_32470 [Bradyrhizobium sp.]|nr:hypothetical protein [Bradyrhizobium sp.]
MNSRRAPLQADILRVLESGQMTASEIAAAVGTTYRSALHAIDALAASNRVLRAGWKRVNGRQQFLFAMRGSFFA